MVDYLLIKIFLTNRYSKNMIVNIGNVKITNVKKSS